MPNFYSVLALLLLGTVPLPGQSETIALGLGSDGWSHLDAGSRENVELGPGYRGSHDIVLRPDSYTPSETTDLLLTFDGPTPDPLGGFYDLVDWSGEITERHSARGTGALLLGRGQNGVVLKASSDAATPGPLFGRNAVWGDVSIEFWLYPATIADGEVVLSWEGSRIVPGGTSPQSVYVDIAGQRLRWSFQDLFLEAGPDGELLPRTVEVTGIRRLIPATWQHHLFRYDADSGLIEYLIDGVPEAVHYATATTREGPEVYTAVTGGGGRELLRVAPSYQGVIDDLRLSREFVTLPVAELPGIRRYGGRPGVAELVDIPLGPRGARLLDIDVGYRGPDDGEVWAYYRLHDFSGSRSGEWIPLSDGIVETMDAVGRYLDIRLELYPDVAADQSPRVTDVRIEVDPDEAPLPPQRVSAQALPGGARLSWSDTHEADVAGYLLYYGPRPGFYFGRGAEFAGVPVDSPIDVGLTNEVTILGLEPGQMYFFAVAAYDRTGITRPGVLSSEESARPLSTGR